MEKCGYPRAAVDSVEAEQPALSPEQRLIAAVLSQAVYDLGNPLSADDRKALLKWFWSRSAAPWTFLWCLDALGLDRPAELRRLALQGGGKRHGAAYKAVR